VGSDTSGPHLEYFPATATLQLGAIPREEPSNWALGSLAAHHERCGPKEACNAGMITGLEKYRIGEEGDRESGIREERPEIQI
jgi:hypothetical protein